MLPALTYQVFLTRNSEYYLHERVCVGVRDRRTGHWFAEHPALALSLAGSLTSAGQFGTLPHLGESLEFDRDGMPLRTSAVLNIEELNLRSGETAVARTTPRPVARRCADDVRVTR